MSDSSIETELADRGDLSGEVDRFYEPSGRPTVPPVKFRPAIDELDEELLRAALGPGAEATIAYLRDCYRRLG